MKIDGREINHDDLCVIAASPDETRVGHGVVISLMPCNICRDILQVEDASVELIALGALLLCIPCALSNYPDMPAGRDPDTGRVVTLQDIANHPNAVGAYDYQDIEE